MRRTVIAIVGLALLAPSTAGAQQLPPECTDAYSETTVEAGVPYWLVVYCRDPEGDQQVTYEVVDPPEHGVILRKVPGYSHPDAFEYLADKSYAGMDSFTFRASDSSGNSAIGRHTITVEPWHDDPPRCGMRGAWKGGKLFVERGGRVDLDVWCNDPENQAITFEVIGPRHGMVAGWLSGGWIVDVILQGGGYYQHDGGSSLTDHVTVTASDGVNRSGPYNRSIFVQE